MQTRYRPFKILATAVVVLSFSGPASAQDWDVSSSDDWCSSSHDHRSDSDGFSYCEVRETLLDSRGEINVDATPNGGISVKAWDKKGILVRAKVATWANSESDAKALADDVKISVGRTVESDGPRSSRDESYSVSYEIFAPPSTDIDLRSSNGGISITGMTGKSRFKTQNGGVSLSTLAGDVSGETTNGGVTVDLAGDTWEGEGLDVETTNGAISIVVPNGYSAELETGTVNGRVKVDFPVMVEGTFDKRMSATLGDGGKTIRAVTTNGSVRIKRG